MTSKLFLRVDAAHLSVQVLGRTELGNDVIAPKSLTVLFTGKDDDDVKAKMLAFLNRLNVQKFDCKTGSAWTLANFFVLARQLLAAPGGLPEMFLSGDGLKLVIALPEPEACYHIS